MNGSHRAACVLLCLAVITASCASDKKKKPIIDTSEYVHGGTSEVMDATMPQISLAIRIASHELGLLWVSTAVDTGETKEGKKDKTGYPVTIENFLDAHQQKVVISYESAGEHQ